MASIPPPPVPTQLIVFADDWGRHPSSTQHLIRELLPQYPTLWVNTVGTRKPELTIRDLMRAAGIFSNWLSKPKPRDARDLPKGLEVIAPKMYPGYRARWQRRLNAWSVMKSVHQNLLQNHRHVVITTLPTTADMIDTMRMDRWLFYCVDLYAQWPGVDQAIMAEMDKAQVAMVDELIAVSQVIAQNIMYCGRSPVMIDHGVDVPFWQTPATDSLISTEWPTEEKPVALFWGLLDGRMDTDWLQQLASQSQGRVVLAGPTAPTYNAYTFEPNCVELGAVPHHDLPAHAACASVLIMPYVDEPVTRMMQPLKLKEYLATMRPVVVRDLPSTRDWADCCDLATDADSFVQLVEERCKTGTPPEQIAARERRLAGESWTAKAAQLAELINADS